MKLLLTLACCVFGASSLLATARTYTCNQELMESYDLDGQTATLPDTNFFCPQIAENCCGYSAQLMIYKKWIIKNEREKINDFYKKFARAYELIFNQFFAVENVAKEVAQATESIPGSNCNKYANLLINYRISEMKEAMLAQVKRTFKYLLQSRQGFYCTLCDAEKHHYFNKTAQQFTVDYSFCSGLVDNTMNYLLFRYKFFVKVARLYSQFLMNCDLHGKFKPDLVISNDIKFFRKDKIVGHLETCRKGYDKSGAMAACEDFCRHFNPVKYDPMFEGEIDKLYALEGFIKRRLRVLRQRKNRELALLKETDKPPKRVLEEAKVTTTPAVLNDNAHFNELNAFNHEFKTVLAMHHPYRFKYDTSIKYHTSFDESLFEPGVEKLFDLVDFKPMIAEAGLDFFAHGDVVIDRDGAMRAFEKLNPEKKSDFDFDDFLKSR